MMENNEKHLQEKQLEEKYLKEVLSVIMDQYRAVSETERVLKTEMASSRSEMDEATTLNFSHSSDKLETIADIHQQFILLRQQEWTTGQAQRERERLERQMDSPYFGRVDFREKGQEQSQRIYVGLASLTDSDGQIWVYDWRAPISSLFYDYVPGPASYQTPDGPVEGMMELKRQFKIVQGQLLHMVDTDLPYGDSLLLATLSGNTTPYMKQIVSTIQREQNRIIRNDDHVTLIIQGAAGSGKTSVALQRIAYLLYKHRGNLTSDQILLLSPNPLFSSYISQVLPELGEANMRQMVFDDLVVKFLGKRYEIKNWNDRTEDILTETDHARASRLAALIEFKSSPFFASMIDNYVKGLAEKGMCFHDLRYRGRVLVTGAEIEEFYYGGNDQNPAERLNATRQWLLSRLETFEEEERDKDWVLEEVDLLDPEVYAKAYHALRKRGNYRRNSFNDFEQAHSYLRAWVVRSSFQPLRKRVKTNRFIDYLSIYSRLFQDFQLAASVCEDGRLPEEWPEVAEFTLESLRSRQIGYEDAVPLMYLRAVLEHLQPLDRSVRYVVVDEGQDYNWLQYKLLRFLYPRARFSIFGDAVQAVYPHVLKYPGLQLFAQLSPEDSIETVTLQNCYRSTKEIVDFANHLLDQPISVKSVGRGGERPQIIGFSEEGQMMQRMIEDARKLLESGFSTIGVLCKTIKESGRVFAALKDHVPAYLVNQDQPYLRKGVMVVPCCWAKGIEFDAVLVHDASAKVFFSQLDRHLLYTMCTRALHRLHLYYTGELTPFVKDKWI